MNSTHHNEDKSLLNSASHPTLGESVSRFWENLPSLWKSLLPPLAALLLVLVPASLFISSRFRGIVTENLRAEHRALLAEIGTTFDEFINNHTQYLQELSSRDEVKNCAPTGCTDSDSESLFRAELAEKLRLPDAYYIEVGFIGLDGRETVRVLRGSGGVVESTNSGEMFSTDPAKLSGLTPGQVYIFPVTRDTRLDANEPYQQPAIRFAMPVFSGTVPLGYVTSVVSLDDFFAQNFVYSAEHHVMLLDTPHCLLASSDDTRRTQLYKTWRGAPDQTCYTHFTLPEWDVAAQRYHEENIDMVYSTRVIHGALTPSGQTWTLMVEQSAPVAYAQANTMQALLFGVHTSTVILVALMVLAADRAAQRLLSADQNRLAAHARDTKFNPYVVGTPIDDPNGFFGRTQAMAQVIGHGVMGGDDVLIEGDPHIGKTSLLRRVERRLRERRVADPTYYYWPVAVSLIGVPARLFYRTIMEQILRDLPDHEQKTDLRFHKQPDSYGVKDFREDINEIVAQPITAGKQTRIVLCLDNIETWFDSALGYDREFRQQFYEMFEDVGDQLKMIATGSHIPLEELNRTISIVTLAPLEQDEAERLIRQPSAQYYTFSDEAVAAIIKYSDCLPMEIQRLARHAISFMLEQDAPIVTLNHAERAVDRAINDWETTFRLRWNGGTDSAGKPVARFTDEQRTTLRDAAVNDGLIPGKLYTGHDALFMRSALSEIAFTDANGNVRLTTLFMLWLGRSGR